MAIKTVTFLDFPYDVDAYPRWLTVELDDQLTDEQIIRALIAKRFLAPRDRSESGYSLLISHRAGTRVLGTQIAEGSKLADYTMEPDDYIDVKRGSKRHISSSLESPITQKQFAVKEGELLPGSNERRGQASLSVSPLDVMTIAASVASVAQLVLMVCDMWSKKVKKRDVRKEKMNEASNQSEVENIRALMSDGSIVQLDAWVADPSSVKKFVDIFQSPSPSPYPIQIVFHLKHGSKVKVDVSDKAANREEFDMLIDYLGSGTNK